VCHVWMFTEPLAPGSGWRDVRVSDRRTAVDWAHQVKALVDDPCYADADWITLVCDQLNTHTLGSLYKAFTAEEALRIANRIELIHTPKHGSPPGVAEHRRMRIERIDPSVPGSAYTRGEDDWP
jgi:hypothetical protein